MIKWTCLLALAASMIATPVLARDKTLYVGVEGGLMKASDLKLDAETSTLAVDDFLVIDHKLGYDIDALFGYDGGMVRAELELGFKRASHDEYETNIPVGAGGIDRFTIDGD